MTADGHVLRPRDVKLPKNALRVRLRDQETLFLRQWKSEQEQYSITPKFHCK